uniref:Uncharacterized protein n=1 Tax=Rhipicephalus zambeziensis TaxID=60191 RepID=A0A224YK21_9ACAR
MCFVYNTPRNSSICLSTGLMLLKYREKANKGNSALLHCLAFHLLFLACTFVTCADASIIPRSSLHLSNAALRKIIKETERSVLLYLPVFALSGLFWLLLLLREFLSHLVHRVIPQAVIVIALSSWRPEINTTL